MRNPGSVLMLLGALLLSALASTAVVAEDSSGIRLAAIGVFVIAAPGLVLTHALRLRDPLLSLVLGMMVGPASWALLATVATFLGLWWPGPTVVVVAVLVGVLALVLLVEELRAPAAALDDDARHRGAFPFH